VPGKEPKSRGTACRAPTGEDPAPTERTLASGTIVRGLRWGNAPLHALLLHEPGADLDAWGILPPRLAARLPLTVEAFDLPGHGLSDDPWQPDALPGLLRTLGAGDAARDMRIVIAAGSVATAVLALAAELHFAGVVLLSPEAAAQPDPLPRSPLTPKLVFAGSLAGDELTAARRLATAAGGWAVVTAVPIAVRGARVFDTEWGPRLADQIETFCRDCLVRPAPRSAPGRSARNVSG
jgi:pimeloyl-ACP methyl ester carboxylesterase